MKLIIGLGNPGKRYNNTRHNIGFMILDEYLKDGKWSKNDYAEYIKADVEKEKVIFIKPTTFMNLSGNAVQYFMNYYKINVENILVIHDDLDLEIGNIKLKANSSSGGHNGVKSIIDNLNTNSFLRLKIGISKASDEVIEYVLDTFPKSEYKKILNNMNIIQYIIQDFVLGLKAEELMNKYNGII